VTPQKAGGAFVDLEHRRGTPPGERNQLARWTGVVVLSFGAIAELLMMPAYRRADDG